MASIPASEIVNVRPNVLSAGGSALDTIGLLLTTNTQVPVGEVRAFAIAKDVSDYFGPSSAEYAAAQIYFNGFDNSNILPASLLFAQYNTAAVAAYLLGGSVSGMTLAELKALTGTIVITFGGVVKTSSSINLSAVTSFSDAATTIQAAFTTPGFSVTYDSVANAFKFTHGTTGAASTIIFATGTGTLYTGIKLTAATGAVLSQGADIAVPAAFMDSLTKITRNWASFTTLFNPDVSGYALRLALAAWTSVQNDAFIFVAWDPDTTPTTTNPASSSLGYAVKAANYAGTIVVFAPTYQKAVFAVAWAASIDANQTEGRTTLAFRSQQGLSADVVSATAANNLIANGYNYYGAYATANDEFVWLYPGSISGDFLWADSFLNQIMLNNALQLALMTLLKNSRSLPYNARGYGLIEAACLDPINQFINFGAIRSGVVLSAQQAALVNNAAGRKIDDVLSTRGWYLLISNAPPQTRAARSTPPITFWYTNGQSVQKISLASVEIQ